MRNEEHKVPRDEDGTKSRFPKCRYRVKLKRMSGHMDAFLQNFHGMKAVTLITIRY